MPLVSSRTQLSQGSVTTPGDLAFTNSGTGAANRTVITGTASLPAIAADEYFEIRNAPIASNNGLYREVGGSPTTSSITAEKVFGANPVDDGADTLTQVLGSTGASTEKSVMIDVQGKLIAIMEQGNVDAEGVTGQAIYSFIMQEFKDDDFLIANSPFPMLAIDSDAGKYVIGQDISGNNNGYAWGDSSTYSIRTRKLLRNAGWDEVDDTGITLARYAGIITLGTFEDETNDNAYYQLGNDTTVDDTINFTFNGPVNESIQFFERLADGTVNGGTGVAIGTDGRTLTRSDTGNWRTDGFIVGGQITIRDAENAVNDSTFLIKSITDVSNGVVTVGRGADATSGLVITGTDTITRADVGGSFVDEGFYAGGNLTISGAEDVGNNGDYTITTVTDTVITVTGAGFTNNADDTTMVLGPLLDTNSPDTTMNVSIDNQNSITLRLRVRDGDTFGKTFSQANLASAGREVLGNFIYSFPLSNATDLKISVADTGIDANSDGTADVSPYSGMSITYFSTAQVRSDLVGGSANFGIIVEGNNGTAEQVFEFIQWSLRATGGNGTGDIDADGDTAYGRAMDELARFVGDTGEFGTGDGINFPRNPDGGGSGVYVDNLNASSKNDVVFYDNTNAQKQFPETIAVTLDFNDIAITADTTTEYDLFYDRTIRTDSSVLTDLVITAGTADSGTITSAGSNLPTNSQIVVGAYVRVSGLTAANESMNGVYQIDTITTAGSAWAVSRYDGADITTTTSAAANMDQNCIDTPDAILVHTNVRLAETTASPAGTAVLAFVSPDQVTDTQGSPDLAKFTVGMKVEIEGSTANTGIYEVATSVAGQLDFVEQTITSEVAGTHTDCVITQVVSGLASDTGDFTFSYDFDNNTQGGRTVSTTTFVKAKAIGSTGAQYVQSTVQSIVTGTPLTIPVAPATERNYA